MSNASVSEKKHWNQLPLPPQSPFLLISFLSTRQEVLASASPREEREFASKVQSTVKLWIHGLSSSMLRPTMLTGCCSSLSKDMELLWLGDLNSVLVVPPSVWGENLMWIAMSHCGAYEAGDATVERALCAHCYCFKSVDLFTQIVQGSFHTFICSLWQ